MPHRVRSVIVACALTVGVLTLAAPAANAEPIKESTIKSECADAGGAYQTGVYGGRRLSACVYRDITGTQYYDTYDNGNYTGTYPDLR